MRPLAHGLASTGNLVKSAGGLLSLLPSALILLGIVPVPASVRVLTSYITTAVTITLLIAVIIMRGAISKMSNLAAAILILCAVAGGAAAAAEYFSFARHHVAAATSSGGDPIIIPMSPSPELQSLMAPYGGDYTEALATSVQRARLTELVEAENSPTIFVMIGLLVAAQFLVIAAIIVGAWKVAEAETD